MVYGDLFHKSVFRTREKGRMTPFPRKTLVSINKCVLAVTRDYPHVERILLRKCFEFVATRILCRMQYNAEHQQD